MSQPKQIGTLVVVVLKARHLHQPSFYKQDPYAQVTLCGQTKKTSVAPKGGQHPEWDDEFRFPVYADPGKDRENRVLEVACYKQETKAEDVLLGRGTVDIEETLKAGEYDDWVQLETSAGARGELYLEMTFYANSPPPTRRPSKLTLHQLARPVSRYTSRDHFVDSSNNLPAPQTDVLQPGRLPLSGPRERTSSKLSSQSQQSPGSTVQPLVAKQKDELPPVPENRNDNQSIGKKSGHVPTVLRPGRGGRPSQAFGQDSRRHSGGFTIAPPDIDATRKPTSAQTPVQEYHGGPPPAIFVHESGEDDIPFFPLPQPPDAQVHEIPFQGYDQHNSWAQFQSYNQSPPQSYPQSPAPAQHGYSPPGSVSSSRPLSQYSLLNQGPEPPATPSPQSYPTTGAQHLPGPQTHTYSSSSHLPPVASQSPPFSQTQQHAQQLSYVLHGPQVAGTPQPYQQPHLPYPPHTPTPAPTPHSHFQAQSQYPPPPTSHPQPRFTVPPPPPPPPPLHLVQAQPQLQAQQPVSQTSPSPPPPPPPPPFHSVQAQPQLQPQQSTSQTSPSPPPPPPPPPLHHLRTSTSPTGSPHPAGKPSVSTVPPTITYCKPAVVSPTCQPPTMSTEAPRSLNDPLAVPLPGEPPAATEEAEARAQVESDIGPKPTVNDAASKIVAEEWERRVEAKKKEIEVEARRRQEEARKTEEERKRREEEEERRIEEEARRRFENEEARRKEAEEKERILQVEAEAEAQRRLEEGERVRREAEEKRLRDEEERRRQEEEESRRQEEERQRQAEEEKQRREAERKQKLEEERLKREEEERRQLAERKRKLEEKLKREEEERKRQEMERKRVEEERKRRLEEEAEAERRWQEELARIQARAEQEAADAAFARAQFEADEAERRRQEEADLALAREAQEEAEREDMQTRQRRRQEEADAEVARREQAHEEELEKRRQEARRREIEEADRELARRLEMEMNL